MLETAFTRLFGLRYPIMQAPMGSVSSPELVAAVSNAGGMGMLACVGLPPELIRQQIRQVRALTDKPFGANLLLPVYQPGQVEACIEERVPLLSLFWGDPTPHVSAAHQAGMKVMIQVGSAEEAQAAIRQAYKILFREGLTIPNALARIEQELPALPELQHLVQFVRSSERGISK